MCSPAGRGADANARDRGGTSALYVAIQKKRARNVRALVSAGARVGGTPQYLRLPRADERALARDMEEAEAARVKARGDATWAEADVSLVLVVFWRLGRFGRAVWGDLALVLLALSPHH